MSADSRREAPDFRGARGIQCRSLLNARLVVLTLLCAMAATFLLVAASENTPPPDQRPRQVRGGGYITSQACRSCHAAQYQTWHASYHRTMSQVVTSESVLADFDDVELTARQTRYRLSTTDGAYWVAINGQPPRGIVQSTGSHHYQLYWYPAGTGRELNMLPFAFLREEKRWVPRDSVFLQPPDWSTETIVWNHQCLPCHTTNGQPGYLAAEPVASSEPNPDTKVAEMGIACEACHGPGKKHAQLAETGAPSGPAIVHPQKISATRSAQVCGQCHSVNVPYRPEDWIDYLLDGPQFRPGDDLERTRYVVDPATVALSPLLEQWLAGRQKNLDDWFWSDGMVRVTGREYNGLQRSPCFAGGEFSCLSCHSPHSSDPDDQLKPDMRGDDACLQCHESLRARISEHTHHRAESSGSRCYNCHMPHTTYGLLKASRSHTVDSPNAATTVATGRPNACNLCHLDQTLAWTARYLHTWYRQPDTRIEGDQAELAAAVVGLLQGDAGQRALYASALGWSEARGASGSDWIAPLAAHALEDPYAVVRYIAGRSLKTLPGFEAVSYDFIAPPEQRTEVKAEVLRLWSARSLDGRREVLLNADGSFDHESARRLVEKRDNHPMQLGE